MRRIAATLTMLSIVACAAPPPAAAEGDGQRKGTMPLQGEANAHAGCDAARAAGLVGKPRSEPLGAEALRRSGARTLRWIPEGSVVTMDYREDRLNIELDRANRVTRIRCG
jgi:hypothetical protein